MRIKLKMVIIVDQTEIRNIVNLVLSDFAEPGGYVIVRAEARREWSIQLSNGSLESVSTVKDGGMGVQVFLPSGVCGFAAADVLSDSVGLELLQKAISLARHNEQVGAESNREIWQVPSVQVELINKAHPAFGEIPLAQLQGLLLKIHNPLPAKLEDVAWRTSYRQIEDIWCIGRSDGTLVSYCIPKAVLMHQGTVKANGRSQSTLVHRTGINSELLLAEVQDSSLGTRAIERAKFALAVCLAPVLPSGHYSLIIDYGLAKGLAHEAFGHAVESDSLKHSVLGEGGVLRRGLKVANNDVHIIDGPLEGDWAYQPYSANGIKRETVFIVQNGILMNGLGDVFSAKEAGMAMTGAERAESYSHIPLPRMSNIRLLVDRMLPLAASSSLREEVQSIRQTLLSHGELKIGKKHLLLLGYRGGQVNPKTGDFVFQCEGIIDIADPSLPVYQASIFGGKILSALQAIRFGIGEGCFDAIGTCGKSGQAVSSSGGSHRYLMLEEDPQVHLGGEGR